MSGRVRWSGVAAGAAAGLAVVSIAYAATKAINLDGRTANAAESAVSLNILRTYPAQVENKITNRAVGDSYTFRWPSAGPGGFSSQLAAGTTAGVGVTWVWQTAQTIYSLTGTSCANDVCFQRLSGPDGNPTNTPPWAVPGRTLVPNSATLSTASLTSSLITFFSPPQTLVEATSSVRQLADGQFAYTTTYTNHTNDPVHVVVPPAPPGCCEDFPQIQCDGTCVNYLWDEDNCGGCGVQCGAYEECYFAECYYDEGSGYSSSRDERVGRGRRAPRGAPDFSELESALANGIQTLGEGEDCGKGIPCDPPPAPVCQTEGSEFDVPPHQSVPFCSTSIYYPIEIAGELTVCGSSIPDGEPTCPGGSDPASQGTFMQYVPSGDTIPSFGPFLVAVDATVVGDTNGDGILQPGETGQVFIKVRNYGVEGMTSPAAGLTSDPFDFTPDNLVNDPASVTIATTGTPSGASPYSPDLAPLIPSGAADCDDPAAPGVPSVNTLAYLVTVPTTHPGDVIRQFVLHFRGSVGGAPYTWTVPVNIGIGSAEADLQIGKQAAPASPGPGQNITYTLSVKNNGPLAATSVVVTDAIPAGTTFVSYTAPYWTCTAPSVGGTGTLSCSRSSLAAGATSTITLVVKVKTTCPTPVSITNTATISSAAPDEITDNNSATTTTPVSAPTPVVQILSPATDQLGLPSLNYPVNIQFSSSSPTPISRETVWLDSCLLWDGLTYGDRDGLLTDEYLLQTNKYFLCQAMARCGFTVMYYPRIRVQAESCGRTGTDDVIYRKNLLKTEVCAR